MAATPVYLIEPTVAYHDAVETLLSTTLDLIGVTVTDPSPIDLDATKKLIQLDISLDHACFNWTAIIAAVRAIDSAANIYVLQDEE